jgi:parvulin-like peptidyl-prolyl isomerase
MSNLVWLLLGAVGASLLWMFFIAFLLDVIVAQRTALSNAETRLRFLRDTRDESDRQVRDLLGQNERLARQLIERAAESTTAPVITIDTRDFFGARRES